MSVLEQQDIWDNAHTVAANGKPLSEKQERGWQLVKTTAGGITADELGAIYHEQRGRHHRDHRCIRCALLGVLDVGEPVVVRMRHEPDAASARLLVSLGAGWSSQTTHRSARNGAATRSAR